MKKKVNKSIRSVNAFQKVIESTGNKEKNNEDAEEVPSKKVKEATDILNIDDNTSDRG